MTDLKTVYIPEVTDTCNPFDLRKGNNNQELKLNPLLGLEKPLGLPKELSACL